MRIAYVYYLITEDQLGVEEKIRQQARAIEAAGLEELELVVLKRTQMQAARPVHVKPFRHSHAFLKSSDFLFRRYALIERTADLDSFDAVLLRYPLADPTGADFCSQFPVVTEHHTLEVPELRARLGRGSVAERLARRLLLLMENRYAGAVLRHCQGITGVTNQITQYEQNRAGGTVPAQTIGNGIDVEATRVTGFTRFDGGELRLVFVAGNLRPWHGLDRLINSVNQYTGNVDVTLHVVGNVSPDSLPGISLERVRFYGPQYGGDLDQTIRSAHLAVDSLAMHRRKMTEGSNLKVRDYTARGIPFIMAHADPDLAEVDEESDFFLSFPNDGSLLDLERIFAFAASVSQRSEEISNYMRRYAFTHMDWKVKLRTYVEFVKRVV